MNPYAVFKELQEAYHHCKIYKNCRNKSTYLDLHSSSEHSSTSISICLF